MISKLIFVIHTPLDGFCCFYYDFDFGCSGRKNESRRKEEGIKRKQTRSRRALKKKMKQKAKDKIELKKKKKDNNQTQFFLCINVFIFYFSFVFEKRSSARTLKSPNRQYKI